MSLFSRILGAAVVFAAQRIIMHVYIIHNKLQWKISYFIANFQLKKSQKHFNLFGFVVISLVFIVFSNLNISSLPSNLIAVQQCKWMASWWQFLYRTPIFFSYKNSIFEWFKKCFVILMTFMKETIINKKCMYNTCLRFNSLHSCSGHEIYTLLYMYNYRSQM